MHREVLDSRMSGVPGLDLEAVDEAPAEGAADHPTGGGRVQVSVAPETVEQHVQAVTEVARAEVGEARLLHGLGHHDFAVGIARHRTSPRPDAVRVEAL